MHAMYKDIAIIYVCKVVISSFIAGCMAEHWEVFHLGNIYDACEM